MFVFSRNFLLSQPQKAIAVWGGLAFCAVLALCSCEYKEGKSSTNKQNGEPEGIEKVKEKGPITAGVRVDRSKITVAERLELTLWAEVDEAYQVELPSFGEKLEEFGIVDYSTQEPELVNETKKRVSRSYVLEPFLSDTYTISPMTITFDKPSEDNKYQVRTKSLEVKVTSLLPEEVEELEVHELPAPAVYPAEMPKWLWVVIPAVGILILVAVIVFFLVRRRSNTPQEMKRPPEDIAYEELEKLVAEQLIEKGEYKQFYYRLSNVVRHYIENRFGLRAPEQTTEEFLDSLRQTDYLPKTYHNLLEDFLKHCDLVKFADFEPGTEDVQNVFDSCKEFIAQTAEKAKAAENDDTPINEAEE